MNALNLAVVGVGHLGAVHARILADMPGVHLAGVVDPLAAARERVAAAYRTTAYASVDDLPADVQAVVLAAPTRWHPALGLDLIGSGRHVLIEKPLAATTSEADQLVAAAKEAGVVLQVGHVERFNPALEAVQANLNPPRFIDAVRCGGFTGRSPDIGVVLDLMIHDIDVTLSLIRSRVTHVEGLGFTVLGGHEDVANARLHFECGGVANLSVSRVSPQAVRCAHVWSDNGFAVVDFASRKTTLIRPGTALEQGSLDMQRLTPEQKQHIKDELFTTYLPLEEIDPEPRDQITAELEDFLSAIQTGSQPRVSGISGRDAVAVAEMVLEKIASHAWDGRQDGRIGPQAQTQRPIIPGPHWHQGTSTPEPRKEAG